jgi:transcription elongation factor/antiterminator RfaH
MRSGDVSTTASPPECVSVSIPDKTRWYVVATKPGQEPGAARHLERQGFETFTPSIVKTVRHARRRMERRVALFPGYLFVRFDIGQCAWRSINGTLGVRSLVMAGERPLPAPRGLVESFIELSDKAGLMQTALECGQRVEILSGPFASWVGTVERLDGRGRVFVLLRLMNGESAVAMDRASLWPAA